MESTDVKGNICIICNNFRQIVSLSTDVIYSLFFFVAVVIVVVVAVGKNESLIRQVSKSNCKKSFNNFFPRESFFDEIIWKGTGKEVGRFFMNKKVCISTNGKVS